MLNHYFNTVFWRHLLSRKTSTIGGLVLDDSVRNGKRYDHCPKSPEHNIEKIYNAEIMYL